MGGRGRIVKQLSVTRLFIVVVLVHFLINFIDQPSGTLGLANAITTTIFVIVFLVVVRLATGAALVVDLLQWCAAWRRTVTFWLLCTFAILFQLIWHLSTSSVSTLLAVSSLISAASMFAAFLSGGVWLRQRISALSHW